LVMIIFSCPIDNGHLQSIIPPLFSMPSATKATKLIKTRLCSA
jgi:hypothetical protein